MAWALHLPEYSDKKMTFLEHLQQGSEGQHAPLERPRKRPWGEYLEALPSRELVCELQEQAKRFKTEVSIIESKILDCQDQRSIKRKIERLQTEQGRNYIYVINNAKADIIHNSPQIYRFDEIDFTTASDRVACTWVMQRDGRTRDEWQENLDQPCLPKLNSLGRVDRGYVGVSLKGWPVDNKTNDWELRFDLDKTDGSKVEEWRVTPMLDRSQWQYKNVRLLGRVDTLDKLRKNNKHQAWLVDHTMAKECGFADGGCPHTQETWEQEQLELRILPVKTKTKPADKANEAIDKTKPISKVDQDVGKADSDDEKPSGKSKTSQVQKDDKEHKLKHVQMDLAVESEDEEARQAKEQILALYDDDGWRKWQATPLRTISLLDRFKRVWLKDLDSKEHDALNLDDVLTLVKNYHPTKQAPFVVDTTYADDDGNSRMDYLVYILFADYDHTGPAYLHHHGLTALCHFRSLAGVHMPVFHIYESDEEGLPIAAFRRIRDEYRGLRPL